MSADIVKKGLRAWEAKDAAAMGSLLSEDFVLTGPVPQPLNKHEFIGFMQAIMTAFPDFKFNEGAVEEHGGHYVVKSRISGTHTGTLTLPGMPPVPATGKKVHLPEEPQTYTVTNGKVSKIQVADVPGGGVPGLLAQIGVQMPH
jgi:predicted ester cyclase